jgi:pyridinium-3,5-biscarboxylic acid mononucleotide synthase
VSEPGGGQQPVADLGFARVDLDRAARTGDPEVVYGAGKTPEQVVDLLRTLHDAHPGRAVLATRLAPPALAAVRTALPSVVGGLVGVPLVAVPTSVGYGASFGGLAALLGMLNSCAPGVTVVNIDNGYGAGVFAARVARRAGTSGR